MEHSIVREGNSINISKGRDLSILDRRKTLPVPFILNCMVDLQTSKLYQIYLAYIYGEISKNFWLTEQQNAFRPCCDSSQQCVLLAWLLAGQIELASMFTPKSLVARI